MCRAGLGLGRGEGLGVARTPVQAMANIEKACDLGSLSACADLGHRPQPDDCERAQTVLSEACAQGGLEACHQLGTMQGDEQWRAACDGGLAEACGDLARSLLDADPPDLPRGIALRDRACKAGHGESCGRLAWRYELGDGVTWSAVQATRLHSEG